MKTLLFLCVWVFFVFRVVVSSCWNPHLGFLAHLFPFPSYFLQKLKNMAFGLIISLTYLRNAQYWTLRREAGVLEYGNPRALLTQTESILQSCMSIWEVWKHVLSGSQAWEGQRRGRQGGRSWSGQRGGREEGRPPAGGGLVRPFFFFFFAKCEWSRRGDKKLDVFGFPFYNLKIFLKITFRLGKYKNEIACPKHKNVLTILCMLKSVPNRIFSPPPLVIRLQ